MQCSSSFFLRQAGGRKSRADRFNYDDETLRCSGNTTLQQRFTRMQSTFTIEA